MENKSLIIFLGVLSAALAVGCILFASESAKYKEEAEKYETVLDYACKLSGDYRTCSTGVEMLKGMDKKELENAMGLWK